MFTGNYLPITFKSFLCDIFINPIPLQFWFIRDLFVLVILSPLIYFSLKFSKGLIIFALFFIWFFNVLLPIEETQALLFFFSGSFFGINKFRLQKMKVNSLFYLYMWICIIIAQTLLIYFSDVNMSILKIIQGNIIINFIDKFGILIGLIAVWNFYDFLFASVDVFKLKWFYITDFSFFLFASHLPALWIISSWINSFNFLNNFSLVVYIFTPSLLIIGIIILGKNIKIICPKAFGLITGGR